MSPLWFVSARNVANETIFAGHWYAATASQAIETATQQAKSHNYEAAGLLPLDLVGATWHARKSTSHANALNTANGLAP